MIVILGPWAEVLYGIQLLGVDGKPQRSNDSAFQAGTLVFGHITILVLRTLLLNATSTI